MCTNNAHKPQQGAHLKSGSVLAFDFGEKRIGIAVGDFETRIASPLSTITAMTVDERFKAIALLITTWHPVMFVVGLPDLSQANTTNMHAQCKRFGNRLNGRFGIPVEWINESYSSCEAEQTLRAFGHVGRHNKHHIDALAARELLEVFFNHH